MSEPLNLIGALLQADVVEIDMHLIGRDFKVIEPIEMLEGPEAWDDDIIRFHYDPDEEIDMDELSWKATGRDLLQAQRLNADTWQVLDFEEGFKIRCFRLQPLREKLTIPPGVHVGFDPGLPNTGHIAIAIGTGYVDPRCPGVVAPIEASVDLWENDEVQFARLLAEIKMAGLPPETLEALKVSMDLKTDQICEILDRAEVRFERLKEQL